MDGKKVEAISWHLPEDTEKEGTNALLYPVPATEVYQK
jgi:hypothetical protein